MVERGSFIESSAWSQILKQGFGATRIETMLQDTRQPLVWTIFRKAGVQVAYASFPVGLEEGTILAGSSISPALLLLRAAGVDLVRISVIDSVSLDLPNWFHELDLVETTIERLDEWSEERLTGSVRSKLRKGRNAGIVVRPAHIDEGAVLHGMYSEMIARHKGRLRYSRDYFHALCRAAAVDNRLSIGVACDAELTPCSFIAASHSLRGSHYLHGGFLEKYAQLRPGYIAMAWAIERSRAFGSAQFNMLASPQGQASLMAYKESFGGTSRLRRHYAVPLTAVGRGVLAGMRVARYLRRTIA